MDLSSDTATILIGLAMIVALALLLVGSGLFIHRRLRRSEESSPPAPFTLRDLRRLNREGQLSDQEFERAKAAMLARLRAADHPSSADDAEMNEPPSPPASGPDK